MPKPNSFFKNISSGEYANFTVLVILHLAFHALCHLPGWSAPSAMTMIKSNPALPSVEILLSNDVMWSNASEEENTLLVSMCFCLELGSSGLFRGQFGSHE